MKKAWILITAVLLVLLTACVQGDVAVKINKDGSGESTITLGIEEEAYDRFGQRAETMLNSVNDELEAQGYTVESYTEDGYRGFRAARSFEDVQDMQVIPSMGAVSETGSGSAVSNVPLDVSMEDGFFTKTYRVEGELDLENSGLLGGMQQLVSNQLDLTFTLDLPISPKDHNADEVNGNVLTWNIQTAGTTELMVEAAVPNVRNIILTAVRNIILTAVGVLLLGVVIFFVVRKRKRTS
ncbi:LPXTG-motif cell wall anchor domain-containing protein [Halobacillus alkaliphilus]|uniref:LPXTG-motif cell wall anchor domain-containing protein n=1 Tax=Halobacillus alkaliphilus TaxID=396056 RepID=A0A1I2KD85_9BACI|nr:LPXTG cell wall anchor domain-containing protein [Halobacillus alkaliphilus]SFF64259.1 LPXTG-motif cell wall anchor domain-containing protein [Halobacillus alkaliphilus]